MDPRDIRKAKDQRVHTEQQIRAYRLSLVAEVKGTRCKSCHGTFDPSCIDLVHREGTEKVATIGKLVRKGSLQQLKDELLKVDPLCAVCHRLVK